MVSACLEIETTRDIARQILRLSLIHISEPTRPLYISYAVFCFGPPDYSGTIPPGLFHPSRVFRGVHSGVRSGGNESGIPTVNGAIVFDERYIGKPLVFCGTVGIMPRTLADGRESHVKTPQPGDIVYMVGGRVGSDGIHGATFSSLELTEESPSSAVQIGDPVSYTHLTLPTIYSV